MKKSIKILIASTAAVVLVFGTIFLYYLFTTVPAKGCIEYCRERTMREATSFTPIGDGRYAEDYIYWIASDGDSSKPQEIFIFKKKSVWPFRLNRYQFVAGSTQSALDGEVSSAGSIQFFTRNNKGEKENTATLLFYGAVADSSIKKYEYTLTVREGSNVYSGNVNTRWPVWCVKFFDLSDVDENTKRVVTDVKFFDGDGNLVCAFS